MITYRRAGINDIDDLVRLRIEFLNEMANNDDKQKDQTIERNLTEYFTKTMKDNSFISWLAIEGNNIIGTSGLCFYSLPPSYKNITGNVAYIMNMYTKPLYRHRGVASSLFEKTIEEAKKLGIKKISLHATEMGRPLYIKFGFEEKKDEMVLYLEQVH